MKNNIIKIDPESQSAANHGIYCMCILSMFEGACTYDLHII